MTHHDTAFTIPPINFSIRILFAIVAAFAVVFASAQSSLGTAGISCVFTFGPIIAYSKRPSYGSIFAGILSAAFWVVIASASTSILFLRHEVIDGRVVLYYSPWFLVVPVIASSVGGYLIANVLPTIENSND